MFYYMDKNRFKMSFNSYSYSYGYGQPKNIDNMTSIGLPASGMSINRNQGLYLKSSIIDRVHKAKPGCSACGKKVA